MTGQKYSRLSRRVPAAHNNDGTPTAEQCFCGTCGVIEPSSFELFNTVDIQAPVLSTCCNQEALGSYRLVATGVESRITVLK